MNRAYSLLSIKAVDQAQRMITGIATTPTPDRMGDIVEPEGAEFQLPLPLLWQHDSSCPIGHVTAAKVTPEGIPITAQLVSIDEPGPLKDALDYAWQSITAGLVRGLSIGFRELEYSRIDQTYSYRFLKWLWLELSAVTIPANSDCSIQAIKSIDAEFRQNRPRLLDLAQKPRLIRSAASGQIVGVVRLNASPGVSGLLTPKPPDTGDPNMRTINEQIAALEAKRAATVARIQEIQEKAIEAGRTKDESEREETNNLKAELTAIDAELVDLKELEKAIGTTVKPADVTPPARTTVPNETRAVAASPTALRSGLVVAGPAMPKGIGFVRLLAAKFIAREQHCSAADVALSKGWGEELASVLRMPRSDALFTKSGIAAANSTDSSWAGPLVVYQNLQQEFIELLRPLTIIGRIPGLRHVPFNVKVPRETGETTGYWVGQGSPKPVSAGALDSVTLDFNKVAGITFMTHELMRFSQPNAETLMVNSLTKALTKLVDNDFLDPSKSAVSGVSPASITNGTTPITATGTSADAFRADFSDLLASYTGANYSLEDLAVVMSQTQGLRLALMRNDFGNREFPDINKNGGFIEGIPIITSENVAANGGSPADGRIIVALSAGNILIADDGGVEVDVSTEATIQADSAPDSPATASTVMVSLWQNNLVGIRCERFVTWTKARSTAAVYITGGNYSA